MWSVQRGSYHYLASAFVSVAVAQMTCPNLYGHCSDAKGSKQSEKPEFPIKLSTGGMYTLLIYVAWE